MAEKYNLQETAPTEKIEAPRSNRIYPVSYEGEITAEEERKKSMAALPANLAGIALYADDYIRQKQYLDYSNDIETLALQQKLDRANEERDLAAEKGNEITNAYIRLQSRIDDVNKAADSDLSVDRVAGIQEVFDDERLLADEQPLYVRERLVDQLDRSQPFYIGKAREAHHNEQIAVAKNNILFRANQLGSAVLDGTMDQETALKEFANAFIPYIGSGKNPGLFSFVDASNAYQSFFQDVVKNTVEGIILRAKSAEEAEKAVKAELAWADKQYLQFMTENGPATFDDGKPMGLWVSAEPNTKEWAYGRLASFKKKEEEKSTFNKADWEKAFEDNFGLKDLDEKGYSDAFNNYSSAELKEKHATLGMAIYNLNCSDAVKRDLLQMDLDLAAANVTYKELLESADQSGNFSQLRQVYNKLQADLMKGAGKVDWINYTIGIAGQNIPLYKALFEQDQYANLVSLNNDRAFQIYSRVSSRLGKILASTNSLYALRSKTIGDVGAEATNLSGRISYADDKWFNPDGSDNKEHRAALATDINRYMAMSAGSSAYVPPNIVTSIDDALKASTSPAKKLMKARIMAQEFNMSGFSDQLLRTYNEKERSGAGLTAEETFLTFAMLYGADAKSANAYDALGRDPVAVTKMFETLSDLKGDALKTAQNDVDKTIDAHDIPDEYRGAVRRALLVQYAMDDKNIQPKGAGLSYSGDANRRDAVLKQNFVAIPGVQGSVYVRHPAFLEGNGKSINMKGVSNALDAGRNGISYVDNALHGTNGAVRSNKADLGVSFDHQRGIFVLTKNGLQVQSYTSKGAMPIGITPKVMLAMQEKGTFVPFVSLRYGFNELAQANLSEDYFSRVNKDIKYSKGEAALSPVRTKQLIHGANTLLSNEVMTNKMFASTANAKTPVSMVLGSNPALADKSSLEYRTLYSYVKNMFSSNLPLAVKSPNKFYGDMLLPQEGAQDTLRVPQLRYMPQQSTKAKLKEKGKEVLDWQRNFPSNFQEWFQNQPSPVYREERPGYSSYIDPAEQYTSFLWRGMSFAGKVNTLPGDTTDITRSACFGNNTMLNIIAFNKDNDYVVG